MRFVVLGKVQPEGPSCFEPLCFILSVNQIIKTPSDLVQAGLVLSRRDLPCCYLQHQSGQDTSYFLNRWELMSIGRTYCEYFIFLIHIYINMCIKTFQTNKKNGGRQCYWVIHIENTSGLGERGMPAHWSVCSCRVEQLPSCTSASMEGFSSVLTLFPAALYLTVRVWAAKYKEQTK